MLKVGLGRLSIVSYFLEVRGDLLGKVIWLKALELQQIFISISLGMSLDRLRVPLLVIVIF